MTDFEVYADGFLTKCAANGVDPQALAVWATKQSAMVKTAPPMAQPRTARSSMKAIPALPVPGTAPLASGANAVAASQSPGRSGNPTAPAASTLSAGLVTKHGQASDMNSTGLPAATAQQRMPIESKNVTPLRTPVITTAANATNPNAPAPGVSGAK